MLANQVENSRADIGAYSLRQDTECQDVILAFALRAAMHDATGQGLVQRIIFMRQLAHQRALPEVMEVADSLKFALSGLVSAPLQQRSFSRGKSEEDSQ